MIPSEFDTIAKLEADLWSAADNLRANSKLTSSEYCMPVLGVIFLRHASNRYDAALEQIQADQASGKIPKRKRIGDLRPLEEGLTQAQGTRTLQTGQSRSLEPTS